MNTSNRRTHSGFTLVELGIAVTLAAIVTGSAVALFVALTKLDSRTRENLAETTIRERFVQQFRADVAEATECLPLDDPASQAGVVLKGPGDKAIFYVANRDSIDRNRYSGKRAVQHESYDLGDNARAFFESPAGSPQPVRCTIETLAPTGRSDQTIPDSAQVRRTMTVVAMLGREQRLADAVEQAAGTAKVEPATDSTESATQNSSQP